MLHVLVFAEPPLGIRVAKQRIQTCGDFSPFAASPGSCLATLYFDLTIHAFWVSPQTAGWDEQTDGSPAPVHPWTGSSSFAEFGTQCGGNPAPPDMVPAQEPGVGSPSGDVLGGES